MERKTIALSFGSRNLRAPVSRQDSGTRPVSGEQQSTVPPKKSMLAWPASRLASGLSGTMARDAKTAFTSKKESGAMLEVTVISGINKEVGGRACKPDSVPYANRKTACARGDHSSRSRFAP